MSTKETTLIKTPVFDTYRHGRKILLWLMPGREIIITKQWKHHYSGALYGKISSGWVPIYVDNVRYFAEPEKPTCPICLCDVEEKDPFTVACCKAPMHAECFAMQLKSGLNQKKKWESSHLKCPLCRANYHNHKRQYDYGPQANKIHKVVPDFRYNIMRPVFNEYETILHLIEQKERGLPETERGGWAFLGCGKCDKFYIPGKLSCAEEQNLDIDTMDLTCPECEWSMESQDHRCFKHGKRYAMYKCDSCCAIASWDCYSAHYCERCHQRASSKKSYPCPGKDKCPLGIAHPPNSHGIHGRPNFGFVIGCYKCQDENYEPERYNSGAPDVFKLGEEEQNRHLKNDRHEMMFAYKSQAEVEEERRSKVEKEMGLRIQEQQAGPKLIGPDAVYNNFMNGFISDEETDSEDLENYQGFMDDFILDESDSEVEAIYNNFMLDFELDVETDSEDVEHYSHFLDGFGQETDSYSSDEEESSDSEEGSFTVVEQDSLSILAPQKRRSFPANLASVRVDACQKDLFVEEEFGVDQQVLQAPVMKVVRSR